MMDKIFKFIWNLGSLVLSFFAIIFIVLMIKDIIIVIKELYEHFIPPTQEVLIKRETKYRKKIKKMLDKALHRSIKRREKISNREKLINMSLYKDII